MSAVSYARPLAAALILYSARAGAAPLEVDLPDALARARRAAPSAVAAVGQVRQARAGLDGADLLFTENPELELGAGPRLADERSIDVEARLEQRLEPWRRGARRALARAELGHAQAAASAEARELDRAVALAFIDGLMAARAEALARHAEELARRAAAAAERRRQAGDATDLELGLARVARGRAQAAVFAASAEHTRAIAGIAALIGAAPDDAVVLRGDLRAIASAPEGAAAADGAARVAQRADVRALAAERDVAEAELAQARVGARPDVGLWASYRREDAASVVVGGLRVTLPVWNRGQGQAASARARAQRATELGEVMTRAAQRQLADARAALRDAQRAVDVFERDVAPILDDSERLLQASFDAGQLAIGDAIVARQELWQARREHLERLAALARAAIEVRYAAGSAP